MKLSDVIEELVEERGLDRSVLSSIICEGILSAYTKKYPELKLQVAYDKKTDELSVQVEKAVVTNASNEDSEISVRKAKFLDKNLNVGDVVWLPFEGAVGRIEILRAKQIIAAKIREIEAATIYNEFKDKQGTVVHGIIHKLERSGAVVKLQETLAFLPKSLTIPGDKLAAGFPIRALLKEVLLEPRNENQLILDRVSSDFLVKLFELEIPEVFEKLVEIKKIVREAGYKAKVAVVSHDKNIDPVGTCVGVGGARIKPILKEIGGEKIDVIAWGSVGEHLIKDALKPAVVNRVEFVDDENVNVWVDEDQRALAIGKLGKNIALASRLVGLNIHIISNGDLRAVEQEFGQEDSPEDNGEQEE